MELRVFLQILLYYLLVLFGCLSAVPLGMTTVNNFPLTAIMLPHYKVKNLGVCISIYALLKMACTRSGRNMVPKSVTSITLVFETCQVCL